MSFLEAYQKYIWYITSVRNFAPGTIKQRRVYLIYLHKWLIEHGVTEIEQVTNIHIDEFHAHLKTKVNAKGIENSIGTVNTSIKAICVFFRWCENYLDIKLTLKVSEIRHLKAVDVRKRLLTFQDVHRVVSTCNNPQDRLMIAVCFEAGLRIDELRNVRYEDFRGTTLDVIGKGSKHRITYVSYELKEEIDQWMKANNWTDGFIFRPIRHGIEGQGYENIDTIRQRIKDVFKKEGIEMHPHMLRHAFALNLLENGCSLRAIQKLLGHANIETTMTYLQVTDKFLEKNYRDHFGGSVFHPLNIDQTA